MAPLFKRRKAIPPPERRDLTVMVAETHGPVPVVLTEDVDRVFAVLDRCLGAAIPEIERTGGRVQVEGGTTVVALWDGDDADHAAVAAALAVHAAVVAAAETARREGESAQVMSLGLESGTVNVGALAAGSWTGEAVIGPPMDRARRFAALARRYRCGIITGPVIARRLAESFLFCRIENVVLKGIDGTIDLHLPLAPHAKAGEAEATFLAAYGAAVNAYQRRDFVRARALWDTLAGGDGLSPSYRDLAGAMAERAAGLAAAPPPKNWNDAWPAPDTGRP